MKHSFITLEKKVSTLSKYLVLSVSTIVTMSIKRYSPIVRQFDIYELNPGLSLYHITPKNIGKYHEEYPHLAELPKDVEWSFDKYRPTSFGLCAQFCNYFDTFYPEKKEFAHLKTKTKKEIRLVDVDVFKPEYNNGIFYQILTHFNFDGFIAFDDPNDHWREVYIIEPNKVLEDVVEYYEPLDFDKETVDGFPHFDREQQNLEKFTKSKTTQTLPFVLKLKEDSIRTYEVSIYNE